MELCPEFDIICLNETNLHNNRQIDFNLSIEGFQPIFRKDRIDKQWGGVAIFVSEHIAAIRRSDLEHIDIEAIWLEIRCVNKKMLLCNCYRPPNAPVSFFNNLSESLEHAKDDEIHDIIVTGDFNSDPIKNSRNYGWLRRACSNFNLENHISEPKRITEQSQTCLDFFFVSNILLLNQ